MNLVDICCCDFVGIKKWVMEFLIYVENVFFKIFFNCKLWFVVFVDVKVVMLFDCVVY